VKEKLTKKLQNPANERLFAAIIICWDQQVLSPSKKVALDKKSKFPEVYKQSHERQTKSFNYR
jgi:hypothetical protein